MASQEAEKEMIKGQTYLAEGEYGKAVKTFKKAIKAAPEEAETYFNYAEAAQFVHEIDPEKVAEAYQKAIELEGDNPFYYSSYGAFCNSVGNFNEAEKMYNKAAEIDPENARLYFSEFAVDYNANAPIAMESILARDPSAISIIKKKALKYALKALEIEPDEAQKLL